MQILNMFNTGSRPTGMKSADYIADSNTDSAKVSVWVWPKGRWFLETFGKVPNSTINPPNAPLISCGKLVVTKRKF